MLQKLFLQGEKVDLMVCTCIIWKSQISLCSLVTEPLLTLKYKIVWENIASQACLPKLLKNTREKSGGKVAWVEFP